MKPLRVVHPPLLTSAPTAFDYTVALLLLQTQRPTKAPLHRTVV